MITVNGVQRSYTAVTPGLENVEISPRLLVDAWDSDGNIDVSITTPYQTGKWSIPDNAEMAIGVSGCDTYSAGSEGGSGWVEITSLEKLGKVPVIVRGDFAVTLVASGDCAEGQPKVCSGSFVATAYK